ncbi:cysteine--tRNA ligase [Sporichthya sp.]|uniref:cysteine--tRNA ligase n=1 Tax=Sporichthya sp. TaxID=65475 RepID=UPI0017C1BF00|nr:cysteine--tRNA ligase [Sporichthya sp.]MBA3742389.1 cysteine--tRNA ligase [Sporichthya sp.]
MAGISKLGSGVVGMAGRISAVPPPVAGRALRLGGVRLPMLSPGRLYVCGITPYDVTHLGHAATFVWADVCATAMKLTGVDVTVCRNITDVDDVLTAAAATRGRNYDEFALSQEFLFEQDMTALRVPKPTHEPRARNHVAHVIALANVLLQHKKAYLREGFVYFRGAHVPEEFGVNREEAIPLFREFGNDPDAPLKDDPFDVAVWRPSDETHPAWPSPWGWGRPGWHAECTAMAHAYLGPGFDVLAGGADLVFPHHAYQIAIGEAATRIGHLARGRLAVGTVHVNGAKMAKSTGNLVLVADLLTAHRAAGIRLFLLDRPWADPWEFRHEDLAAADARLDRIYAAAGKPGDAGAAGEAVITALLEDLDVPTALNIAEEAGGDAARFLLRTLRLDGVDI